MFSYNRIAGVLDEIELNEAREELADMVPSTKDEILEALQGEFMEVYLEFLERTQGEAD